MYMHTRTCNTRSRVSEGEEADADAAFCWQISELLEMNVKMVVIVMVMVLFSGVFRVQRRGEARQGSRVRSGPEKGRGSPLLSSPLQYL